MDGEVEEERDEGRGERQEMENCRVINNDDGMWVGVYEGLPHSSDLCNDCECKHVDRQSLETHDLSQLITPTLAVSCQRELIPLKPSCQPIGRHGQELILGERWELSMWWQFQRHSVRVPAVYQTERNSIPFLRIIEMSYISIGV